MLLRGSQSMAKKRKSTKRKAKHASQVSASAAQKPTSGTGTTTDVLDAMVEALEAMPITARSDMIDHIASLSKCSQSKRSAIYKLTKSGR